MNKPIAHSGFLPWLMALLLVALMAGCGGGGGGGQGTILGANVGAGAIPGAPAGAIPPLPVIPVPPPACLVVAAPGTPTVTSSNPTNGNQNATTSTTGVANNGKAITATFSLPMNGATLTPVTFTVAPVGGAVLAGTTVTYDAVAQVATLKTASALSPNTSYTAIITQGAVTSANGTPLSCTFAWNFKTANAAATGQAPVNLGTASPFGIFVVSNASLTLTGPSSLINGDVGFMANGAGSCIHPPSPADITCAGAVPAINGVVHNGDAVAAAAQIAFNAAYTDAANRGIALGRCTLATNTEIAGPQGACAGYAVQPGSLGPTGFPTYLPGLYWSATSITFGAVAGQTIVLDAQNDPDGVFIFQAGSTLGTGATSTMILANGAQAKNVFWTVGSATTLGTSSTFKGTVITLNPGGGAVTLNGGTAGLPQTVEGRMLSGAAATVGTFATITVPQ